MLYYLIANEHSWTTSDPSDDDGEWTWQGSSDMDVVLTRLSLTKPQGARMGWHEICDGREAIYGVESVPVGSLAYVLVVRYTSGGTFGSSGYWCAAGVFASLEAAEAARKRAEGDNDTERYSRPWDGYFASLTEARIDCLTVQP